MRYLGLGNHADEEARSRDKGVTPERTPRIPTPTEVKLDPTDNIAAHPIRGIGIIGRDDLLTVLRRLIDILTRENKDR